MSAAGAMKIADDAARVVYLKSLSKLAGLLEQEVSAVRKGLGSAQRSDIESFQKDIAARTVLLNRKTIDLGKQQKLANSYYGSSPFGKSAGYYAAATFQNIATGRIKVSNTQEALNAAYRAAYTVQLREAEIKMLHAQIAALQQALHTAQEQLRVEAEAQARARQEAEAQARARQEAEAMAREQERALAEAEAQKERGLSAARAANTYNLELSAVAAPRFVTAFSATGQLGAVNTLAQAISAAIAELKNAQGILAGPLAVGIAALLYPSELGDGELPNNYLLSTPLADLAVDLDSEAQAAALASGVVDLSVRMGSQSEEANREEVFVARTDGAAELLAVRVLAATFNAENGSYSVTTEDMPPRTLLWTPVSTSESSSTTSPATPPSVTTHVGPTLEPIEGRLDSFPELEDTGFDDYVIIFPVDSGLPPIYVMFKSRRYMPGVVTGKGELTEGHLLVEGNEKGRGIPEGIANEMRGRKFRDFGAFRIEFWMLLSNSQEFSAQFDHGDIMMMRRGLAPLALPNERVGGRVKYEIHHKQRIADGGGVYDIDNMVILSPKFHIKFHRGD
ncbi:S-type pyocin domain-containing protein [Pseudomonas plecoglossicida]|nr:S-type pyocin domain-containing protein [Pseudomonas plecoglossicida]